MIEQGESMPVSEIPASALAIIARQHLETGLSNLSLDDQTVNKLASVSSRAISNLQFLEGLYASNPALRLYLGKEKKELAVCTVWEAGVIMVSTSGAPIVWPKSVVIWENGIGISKFSSGPGKSIDPQTLSDNDRLARKLAKMSKEKILKKLIKKFR